MQDGQKLNVLENIIGLLSHRHPESTAELSLLNGAIKQWAESFYQQLIEKNRALLRTQYACQVLEGLKDTIRQIDCFLKQMCSYYNDPNIEFYYHQYIGVVAPVLYAVSKESRPNPQENSNGNHITNFIKGNPPYASQAIIRHAYSDNRGNFNKNRSTSLQNSKFFGSEQQPFNVFYNHDIPMSLKNLQRSVSFKSKPAHEDFPHHFCPQRLVRSSKFIQHDFQSNPNATPKSTKTIEINPNEYSECIKRLKRQLLNLKKQTIQLNQKNSHLKGELKKLEGRFMEKQKQLFSTEQKLCNQQKLMERLHKELLESRNKEQSSNLSHPTKNKIGNKLNNSEMENEWSSSQFARFSEPSMETFKENDSLPSNLFKLKKRVQMPEMGEELRMLLLQAITVQHFIGKKRAQE